MNRAESRHYSHGPNKSKGAWAQGSEPKSNFFSSTLEGCERWQQKMRIILFIFWNQNQKNFKYSWGRWKVTTKIEDYFFWNQNKKWYSWGRWKVSQEKMRIINFNPHFLVIFSFLNSSCFLFWLKKQSSGGLDIFLILVKNI